MSKPRTLPDLYALLGELGEAPSDDGTDPFDFTPVPSASTRHDGWTPERQRLFIAGLAKIGAVRPAARSAGMSAKSAYALRRRAGPDSSFAAAWDRAVEAGGVMRDGTAIDRAIEGEEVPVFYRGQQVGSRKRYNTSLLLAAMRPRFDRNG
ncbi:hypothetical protein [Sphingomonas immobilis]|uniref:Transposase n=1 Tax=Sphingomonas immobilis TaxID=3063997 RepID=A0ABT8ZYH4_9SPHN|nr:hypothetical protein [Sphingomonas sp. CA1-15]MDO7842624.1 hypothetical protein [Sphingomonas sp. CA1-15]